MSTSSRKETKNQSGAKPHSAILDHSLVRTVSNSSVDQVPDSEKPAATSSSPRKDPQCRGEKMEQPQETNTHASSSSIMIVNNKKDILPQMPRFLPPGKPLKAPPPLEMKLKKRPGLPTDVPSRETINTHMTQRHSKKARTKDGEAIGILLLSSSILGRSSYH